MKESDAIFSFKRIDMSVRFCFKKFSLSEKMFKGTVMQIEKALMYDCLCFKSILEISDSNYL